ncbi:MAG: class I SAM-dependent methyltransferase [Spirochaetales bacterium]|nr:class I SAM-dependent methyltransferase [Spirochaetales bacterium]
MGFYEAISPYYDLIFPVEPGTVEFLALRAQHSRPSLDVACGTGGHAVALARLGFPVTGVDLDAAMIERARAKAGALPVSFQVMDMEGLEGRLPGGYGLAYCIGNSLVHLDSEERIARALGGWYRLLSPGAVLVIQVIHYDGVLARGAVGLPTLRDPAHGLEFTRRYDYEPGSSSVMFRTVLSVDEPGGPRRIEGSVPLRILKRADLERLVRSAGYRDVETFGGFDGSPLTAESLPLVLVASR